VTLEILIDDDKTRALWETAKKAKAEVESYAPHTRDLSARSRAS
jgi:hypothetical protein